MTALTALTAQTTRRAAPDTCRAAAALCTALLFLLDGCGGSSSDREPPPPPAVAGLRCSGPQSTGWCWQSPLPWAPVIDDVQFIDSRTGWAVGDALLRSTDGGGTWQEQAMPGGTQLLRAVRFANASEGWLLSRRGGQLWRTRDGGQTWIAAASPLPLDDATALVLFSNGSMMVNGFESGPGGGRLTLLSDDGAASWRTSARFVYPELADADGTLWGIDQSGRFFAQSVDGGRSFAAPAAWGEAVQFFPLLTGGGGVTAWASVFDHTTGRYGNRVLQRQTSGGTWTPVAIPPVPARHSLRDVALFTSGGWALTDGSLEVTTDAPSTSLTLWRREAGAAEWTTALASQQYGSNHSFVDGRTVWLQAMDQAPVLSTDGGRNWVSSFAPSADPADPLRLLRRDGAGALLAGYGGTGDLAGAERWYRSTDEGRSWRALPGTGANGDRITGLWMFDAQRGLAATSGGRWLDTSNTGRDWTARPDTARLPGSLQDLQFTPGGTGWVVAQVQQPVITPGGPRPSAAGPLYRSVDQGRSWVAVPLPEPAVGKALGVQFVDDRNGFLRVSNGCNLVRFYLCDEQTWATRDAGVSWQAVGREWRSGGLLLMSSATQGVRMIQGLFTTTPSQVGTTTDGGATWSDFLELPGSEPLHLQRLIRHGGRLWLLGHAWSTGQAFLLSSSDGGLSWVTQSLTLPADALPSGVLPGQAYLEPVLNDIAFADANNGWIVGPRGLVLATQDGGATWVRQASGSRQNLQTVRAVSAQTAWIGGSASSILATASGGR